MSETLLKIDIVTPRNTAYTGVGHAITLPGTLGPFQVLINHAPIISSLEVGAIKIIDEESNEIYFATNGGFAEIKNNVVSIVVESAEAANDIDVDGARAELENAQRMYDEITNQQLRAGYKDVIHRAQNRIKIVEAAGESLTLKH